MLRGTFKVFAGPSASDCEGVGFVHPVGHRPPASFILFLPLCVHAWRWPSLLPWASPGV